MKSPVLITGASGFVGSNLLRRLITEISPKKIHVLLRRGSDTWRIKDLLPKVSVHMADLKTQSAADALVQTVRPKTIFHLATHGGYSYQQNDEQAIIDTNIVFTFHLMQACLRVGFDAFVNTGSSSEYGAKKKPMSEKDVLHPGTAYGASKAWATMYGEYLALAKKAPVVTLRPFTVYGAYEARGRLIPNIILALLNGEAPRLASPRIARDFIFIDDMIGAYIRAAERPSAGAVFNIGSGKQATIKEIFDVVRDIMEVDVDPRWDRTIGRSFDTNHWVADIRLAQRQLGWKPKTSLQNGLWETVAWFKKNAYLYEA